MKIMLVFMLIGTLATAGCQAGRPGTAISLVAPTSTVHVETREPVAIIEIDNDIVELSSLSDPSPQQSAQLNDLLTLRSGFEQQANAIPGWAEVKPENMEFAIVTIYDAGGSVAGGFVLVKNLETSEQMVLSEVEKIEADGTVTRKEVNLPLQARFSIDAQGRFVNGDWYYVDQEENKHVLYKTNDIGQLGGVPIEGNIIWSETVFGIETISDLQLAKLAEIVLPPGDLAGLTIDTELGQIMDAEGKVIFIYKDGKWEEPQVDLTSLLEPGQEIREVNGYQAVGYEYKVGFPSLTEVPVFEQVEFRMVAIQGERGSFRAINGKVERFMGGQWEEMVWPEGVKEIVFFDIKDNNRDGTPEIYAIDQDGLARAELVNEKWERYVRELRGLEVIPDGKYSEANTDNKNTIWARLRTEPAIMNEPNLDEVARLTGPDEKPLEWDAWWGQCWNLKNDCHVGELTPRGEGEIGLIYMPAVIVGVFPGNEVVDALVVEIPRRYDRVVQALPLGNTPSQTNYNVYPTVDESWKWGSISVGNLGINQIAMFKRYEAARERGETPNLQVMVRLEALSNLDKPGYNWVYRSMAEMMADERLSDGYFEFVSDGLVLPTSFVEFK